eukprot:990360-Rhodomonas_salina.2
MMMIASPSHWQWHCGRRFNGHGSAVGLWERKSKLLPRPGTHHSGQPQAEVVLAGSGRAGRQPEPATPASEPEIVPASLSLGSSSGPGPRQPASGLRLAATQAGLGRDHCGSDCVRA